MGTLGKALQVLGLGMTGFAAIAGFASRVSEGFFISVGLGGFLVFAAGGFFRGRTS